MYDGVASYLVVYWVDLIFNGDLRWATKVNISVDRTSPWDFSIERYVVSFHLLCCQLLDRMKRVTLQRKGFTLMSFCINLWTINKALWPFRCVIFFAMYPNIAKPSGHSFIKSSNDRSEIDHLRESFGIFRDNFSRKRREKFGKFQKIFPSQFFDSKRTIWRRRDYDAITPLF